MDHLPPGPPWTEAEQTFRWFGAPYEFARECRQRFGDTFTITLSGTGQHVFVSHPRSVRQVFTADHGRLHAGAGNAVWLSFMGRNSLLLLDGDAHLRMRRLVVPAFSAGRVARYGALIESITESVTQRWPENRSFAALPCMLEISLEVILRAVFGFQEGPRLNEIRTLSSTYSDAGSFGIGATRPGARSLGKHDPWDRFRRQSEALDDLLYQEIAQRRSSNSTGGEDILSYLLSTADPQGATLTDEELRDQLVTLIMAGHETTAATLAWALYWIHSTPSVKEKVREPLDALAGSPVAAVRMPYLEACIEETLRLVPTIPMVSRGVAQPIKVEGWELPPGTNVSPCVYLTQHREDVFADPEAFRPERFLERRWTPYEYYPFGGGERRCPGRDLALVEMRIVLAALLRSFDFTLAGPVPVRPVRRNVTICPAGGLPVVMRRRSREQTGS